MTRRRPSGPHGPSRAARVALEEQQRPGQLPRAVLQAEQGVATRQRAIREAETDLARQPDELSRQRAALVTAQAATTGAT